jgi:tetratricopeptide (TPR) repeat protein
VTLRRAVVGLAAVLALGLVFASGGCSVLSFRGAAGRHTVAETYRAKAQLYERDGALRAALEAVKVALTVEPDDAGARALKVRLEARIERAVAEHVQRARAAVVRHEYLEARREYLAALALEPSNTTAFEGLRNDVKEVRFVVHTVRPGETLGSIAELYYGDHTRSEVIWETNQLGRNPKLTVGAALRVPEIPGVPFMVPPRDGGADQSRDDVAPEVDPLLAEAREALERQDFAEALADVDRVLTGNPNHPEGVELKKSILYTLGKTRLGEKRYDESYRALLQLSRLAPKYEDAGELAREAHTGLVQQRYNEGLRLYREEKLEDAIVQWRSVLELEPRHANARKNIEQAEQILKKLDERSKR